MSRCCLVHICLLLGVQDPKNSPEGWCSSKRSSMRAQAELGLGWLMGWALLRTPPLVCHRWQQQCPFLKGFLLLGRGDGDALRVD